MKKREGILGNATDRIFIGATLMLIFIKVSVDAFNLYGNAIRDDLQQDWWQPFVEQYTSFATIAISVPFIVCAVRKFSPMGKTWLRNLVFHIGFSFVFFILHVGGFVVLRKLIFALSGSHYSYGGFPKTALLEYPLDFSTYLIVAAAYGLTTYFSTSADNKEIRIELSCGSHSIWVRPSEILYAKAAGNYVDVVLEDKTHLIRSTLEDLQTLVNSHSGNLRRIHRSVLVNPHQVRERSPVKNGARKLTMRNGDVIAMSRRYKAALD